MFHPLPQSLSLIQLSFSNGSIIKNDCSELEAELWLQFNNATDDLKPNVTIKIENIQSHYCPWLAQLTLDSEASLQISND